MCVACTSTTKQRIVRIEHLTRQQLEPLTCQSSRVFPLLIFKLDLQLALELLRLATYYLFIGLLKNIVPAQTKMNDIMFSLAPHSLKFGFEDRPFILKREHVRRRGSDSYNRNFKDTAPGRGMFSIYQRKFALDVVVDIHFEIRISYILSPQLR